MNNGINFGLIAGNGQFPFLVLEGARRQGVELSVIAIKEETERSIEESSNDVRWVGIGQLGKMISFFKDRGVSKVIMAGQVKHVQIFSSSMPDMRMGLSRASPKLSWSRSAPHHAGRASRVVSPTLRPVWPRMTRSRKAGRGRSACRRVDGRNVRSPGSCPARPNSRR